MAWIAYAIAGQWCLHPVTPYTRYSNITPYTGYSKHQFDVYTMPRVAPLTASHEYGFYRLLKHASARDGPIAPH